MPQQGQSNPVPDKARAKLLRAYVFWRLAWCSVVFLSDHSGLGVFVSVG